MHDRIVNLDDTGRMLDFVEHLLRTAQKPLEAKRLLADAVRLAGNNPKNMAQLAALNSAISQDLRFVPARVLGKATPHTMPPGLWRPNEKTKPYHHNVEPNKYRERNEEFHPAWALREWHIKSEFTQMDELESEADTSTKEPKRVRRVKQKASGDAA